MKQLYLIRHAKSSWSDPSATDFERKLNSRGKADAPAMAARLAKRKIVPDYIVSSPAKRAKKTAKIFAKAVGFAGKKIVYDPDIYSSSLANLFKVVHGIDDEYDTAFFVGHNYAITDFAETLTQTCFENIPTSGIVAIALSVSCWREVQGGCGRCVFFDYPKKFRIAD